MARHPAAFIMVERAARLVVRSLLPQTRKPMHEPPCVCGASEGASAFNANLQHKAWNFPSYGSLLMTALSLPLASQQQPGRQTDQLNDHLRTQLTLRQISSGGRKEGRMEPYHELQVCLLVHTTVANSIAFAPSEV